jgi:hypothetical protein
MGIRHKDLIHPNIFRFVLTAMLAVAIWSKELFFPGTMESNTLIAGILTVPSQNGWISFFLTLAVAYLLFRLMERFTFIQQRTFLPFFFFLLLTGSFPSLHHVTNGMFGFLLLYLSIWQILSTFHKTQPTEAAFNAGIFLSAGYFFVADFFYLVPFLFICLYIVNNLTARVFMSALLGLLTPVALVFGGSYWFGCPDIPVNHFLDSLQFDFAFADVNHGILILRGIFSVIALIAVAGCFQNRFSSSIAERKNLQVFVWIFSALFILTSLRITKNSDELLTSYLGICSVIFAINYSFRISRNKIITFFVLLALLFLNLILSYYGQLD